MISEILSVNLNDGTITEEDALDFSTMNNVSSCAFRGIVSSVLGKQLNDTPERNMALEAGDLCHKVYAVWRALSIKDEDLQDVYVKKFF